MSIYETGRIVDRDERIKQLMQRVKELEEELDDANIENINAGYEQCLQDLQGIARDVMELVWARGPVEGLEVLLKRLEEKDVPVYLAMHAVPHDWLSRWKVELA